MSLRYKVVSRPNPLDRSAPPKFYPSVRSGGRITIRQLCEMIADISTVSTIDTVASIEAFLQTIPRELSKGNIVDLGDFGSFHLKAQTEGADKPEKVTSHNIKKVMVQFVPGKLFKQMLLNTTFEKE